MLLTAPSSSPSPTLPQATDMSSSPAPVELDFLGLLGAAADHRGSAATNTTASSSIGGMRTSAIASIGSQQLRRVIVAAEPPSPTTMTLFYNGAVATFDDVPRDKAEAIMRIAAEVARSDRARGPAAGAAFASKLAKDMPRITRTRSLQHFLQKRKERLARVGPYQSDAASKCVRVKEEAA